MLRSIHFLLVLVGLFALCPGVSPRASVATQAAPQATGPDGGSAGLIPLPKSCGGTLPPGSGVPACCMFGYVFIDGQAVEGARLTITSAHGTLQTWTERGADSANPYYRVSLSDAPLALQAGDTLTITADYSTHRHTLAHTVLSGGQQVDVVLPRNQPDDYTFDRQVAPLPKPGQIRYSQGIAVDGAGVVYLLDRAAAQIQVFNSRGSFCSSGAAAAACAASSSRQMGSRSIGRAMSMSPIATTGASRSSPAPAPG